jgi:hypothetical protein
MAGYIAKVIDQLTHNPTVFDAENKENSNIIIITSLCTLTTRHGPRALKGYRVKQGQDEASVKAKFLSQDPNWPSDLSDCFSTIAIDKAYYVKNDETSLYATIRWLYPKFIILATTSVLPNSINDFKGYISFLQLDPQLWSSENLQKWNVTKHVNPYQLNNDHPAMVLQIIYHAIQTFIIEHPDATKAGLYLRKIWRKCMIRRIYASPDPHFPSRIVGAAITNLFSHRVICNFNTTEHDQYMHFSEYPLSKLMTILPNRNLVWNRHYSRQLVLNSSWLGFHYIRDRIQANTIEK